MAPWRQWILADAPLYGVDPRAALSISSVEGLSGRAGDNNTSFGPFQLHVGGALPRGRGRKWAESRAGVDYALRSMAESGARGLRGQRAISVIASRFEKPADVANEIRKATNFYRHTSGIKGRQAQLTSLARNTARGTIPTGIDSNRIAAIGMLLSQVNPEVAPIIQSALAAQSTATQEAPMQPPRRPRSVAKQVKQIDGMQPDFQRRLNEMIAASGGRIRINSGFRSTSEQARLFAQAVRKYGSPQAARKWVAPPGHSNHNKGIAADLGGDIGWAHANASKFGLYFPMSWENWHIEPIGSRR